MSAAGDGDTARPGAAPAAFAGTSPADAAKSRQDVQSYSMYSFSYASL